MVNLNLNLKISFMHSNWKDMDMVVDMRRCLPAGSQWLGMGKLPNRQHPVCLINFSVLQLAK